MKECMNCGFHVEPILVTITDAKCSRTLCPNCYVAAVVSGQLSFEPDYDLVCDITGRPGAVRFGDAYESFTLAPRAMLRLLAHDLRPNEWKALVAKYGSNAYMLHDDFYTADGEAWQPAVHVPVYEWRDVVEINGKHYCECFEISGEMDGDDAYQIDWFLEAVAEKYGVDVDDVQTYMMENIDFDPAGLEFGAEDCGCYIDGRPEWCITKGHNSDSNECPFGGDIESDCADCAYARDYHFSNGECVQREPDESLLTPYDQLLMATQMPNMVCRKHNWRKTMEKTVKVTVNLKHARMGLRLAGYYDLAQNGSDEEVFKQVLEMITDYGAKTEILSEPQNIFSSINKAELSTREQVELAVRGAAAEHANSEEVKRYIATFGEDAFEEIILELIDQIAAEREAESLQSEEKQEA